MDYDTGVAVMLVVVFASLAWRLGAKLSIYESNLKQIGYRTKLSDGEIRQGGSVMLELIAFAIFAAIEVALSWVGLAAEIMLFFWRRHRDSGAPPEVLRLRWRLKNTRMSADQVRITFERIAVAMGTTPEQRAKMWNGD